VYGGVDGDEAHRDLSLMEFLELWEATRMDDFRMWVFDYYDILE
jgi:hypothetical protein